MALKKYLSIFLMFSSSLLMAMDQQKKDKAVVVAAASAAAASAAAVDEHIKNQVAVAKAIQATVAAARDAGLITDEQMNPYSTVNIALRNHFNENTVLVYAPLRALILSYVGPRFVLQKTLRTSRCLWGEHETFMRGACLEFADNDALIRLKLVGSTESNPHQIVWNHATGTYGQVKKKCRDFLAVQPPQFAPLAALSSNGMYRATLLTHPSPFMYARKDFYFWSIYKHKVQIDVDTTAALVTILAAPNQTSAALATTVVAPKPSASCPASQSRLADCVIQ